MYRIARIAIAALASVGMLASVAACGSGRSSSEKNGTIEVVASVNQWGTVAKTLGGGNVNVTSIINSTNVDAHDYEPTTSDIAKLQKAQVIIVNGAGYDAWAVKAAQSANATIVNAAAVGMNSQLITSATSPNEIIENGNAMTWIIGFMEALISAMNKANAAMPSTGGSPMACMPGRTATITPAATVRISQREIK